MKLWKKQKQKGKNQRPKKEKQKKEPGKEDESQSRILKISFEQNLYTWANLESAVVWQY